MVHTQSEFAKYSSITPGPVEGLYRFTAMGRALLDTVAIDGSTATPGDVRLSVRGVSIEAEGGGLGGRGHCRGRAKRRHNRAGGGCSRGRRPVAGPYAGRATRPGRGLRRRVVPRAHTPPQWGRAHRAGRGRKVQGAETGQGGQLRGAAEQEPGHAMGGGRKVAPVGTGRRNRGAAWLAQVHAVPAGHTSTFSLIGR